MEKNVTEFSSLCDKLVGIDPRIRFVGVADKHGMILTTAERAGIIPLLNELFHEYNDINFPERGKFGVYSSDFEKEILSIIERHPMRQEQILETFSSKDLNKKQILSKLENLESERKIEKIIYLDNLYWKLS